MKKLSELRSTAPVSEEPKPAGFVKNPDGTRNYWDGPCWSRTSDKSGEDDKSGYRIRHICKLCRRHDMEHGCYRLMNGNHAWVCDECYAAQPDTIGGNFLDTGAGAIPMVLKPRFERKADGQVMLRTPSATPESNPVHSRPPSVVPTMVPWLPAP